MFKSSIVINFGLSFTSEFTQCFTYSILIFLNFLCNLLTFKIFFCILLAVSPPFLFLFSNFLGELFCCLFKDFSNFLTLIDLFMFLKTCLLLIVAKSFKPKSIPKPLLLLILEVFPNCSSTKILIKYLSVSLVIVPDFISPLFQEYPVLN